MIHGLRTMIAAVALLLTAPVALAQESSMTAEVQVDATGASGTEAKAQALAKGEQEAFRKILSEMFQGQEAPAYDASQVSALVDSFSVSDEKIASNRYRATVSYQFNLERVTAFLAGAAVAAPETAAAAAANQAPGNKILALAPIASLQEWQDIRTRMERSGAVLTLRIMAFSLDQVDVEIGLGGDPNRLAQALKAQGLSLQREGDFWVIRKG